MKPEVLACKDFSPEVIRSLVSLLTKAETRDEAVNTISSHLAKPDQYVYDFFNNISPDKRLLLLSIAVSPSNDTAAVEGSFLTLLEDCNLQPSVVFETFIDELDGSIIKRRNYLETSEMEYYHPSMFDAIVRISGGDKHYRGLMLKHVNIDLLWLLTLRQASGEANGIQVREDDFDQLLEGLRFLLLGETTLRDATTILQWTTSMSNDLAYNILLQAPVRQLKGAVAERIADASFYDSHSAEPVEHWINLLNKWQGIYGSAIAYCDRLELRHRNYSTTSYWSLVFLLEHVSRGFIESRVNAKAFEAFTNNLTKKVKGLKLGLNPKTHEQWLPIFYELDDLIHKMKKSNIGRQITDSNILADWDHIKRHSEHARNRHSYNVTQGWWKTIPRIRSERSTLNWA
jgi:hypothetical protein